jgi:hypothetical protein
VAFGLDLWRAGTVPQIPAPGPGDGAGLCDARACRGAWASGGLFGAGARVVVYLDPPYLPSTRRGGRLYRYELSEADHVVLLAIVRALPCPVLLHGYPSALYDAALVGWRRVCYKAMTRQGLRDEVLWLNFPPPQCLHDYRHAGRGKTGREAIRRRARNLRAGLLRASPLVRGALLQAVAEVSATQCDDFPALLVDPLPLAGLLGV